MELIISHTTVDFDGFASMLAAKKLYPGAEMSFSGRTQDNVQDFFSLYKNSLQVMDYKVIDFEDITKLILVDTKNANRIGLFAPLLENPQIKIEVYDHHPPTSNDIKADYEHTELLGAATTILVERIMAEGLSINPFEATVFALGIYEDTGCLVFSHTTPRDIRAAALLLEKGANLEVVEKFIEPTLNAEQQDLLNHLVAQSHVYQFNGSKVLIARGSTQKFVSGLDLLTHRLRDIMKQDAVFTVVEMEGRIFMVARSSIASIKVNHIIEKFGGAGHDKAASTVIKGKSMDEVLEELKSYLADSVLPEKTARELMSAPVKIIESDLSVHEAGMIMMRYGHTGFPVMEENQMVGIISRRDVEKAEHHGLGHAPVKGFMSRNVISISPGTLLPDIKEMMIKRDIGRLPVMEGEALIGIISRTDVLRMVHGSLLPDRFQINYQSSGSIASKANILPKVTAALTPEAFQMIESIGLLADRVGYKAYLVGGIVRDILLEAPCIDFDIVIEGDGLEFARLLGEKHAVKPDYHHKFGTATLTLKNDYKIDIASSRTEYYQFPAALPTVESGSLKQDLYRRDFTINAMAIALNHPWMGNLIDFFGGSADLREKSIRVLYNLSFIEDPTRMIRAVRFEQRYGFQIEAETLKFAGLAAEMSVMEKVSPFRLKEEIILLLKEDNALPMIERLEELGLWRQIIKGSRLTKSLVNAFGKIPALIKQYHSIIGPVDKVLVYLSMISHNLSEADFIEFLNSFQWTKCYQQTIIKSRENKRSLTRLFKNETDVMPGVLHDILGSLPPEGFIFLLAVMNKQAKKHILEYLEARKNLPAKTSGLDLKKLGVMPGPIYKNILDQVIRERLNGKLSTWQDEQNFIKNILDG